MSTIHHHSEKEEKLPLVDTQGRVIGMALRSEVHNGTDKPLHPVVHLQVVKNGGVWLQKRPLHKLVQPGKWDTAVGGHISYGESVELSLQRESEEEIGINPIGAISIGKYIWESDLERELVYVFVLKHDGEIQPNPEELDGGKVWQINEIEENLGKGVFTPNFEHEFRQFKYEITKAIR
ncbi:NUDIX hydrolase [Natronoflexus pectinivorans]|uniref:Isopentenyldiphosphate isomerase n=1 Tax=Natronoflexus pectinivorans TaxID=682526 RepID=A0A4R2GK28_9BACT|nr:NUDIX domain-containing protein [Natronoflexus pectinivorans]TCO09164.1 isopentenyldiphosphate isomerase [Natronoflexus pectinivorans]